MILTAENYFSQEANNKYLSVSQYKDFCGSLGKVACEEQALAKLNGDWEMEKTTALMVGSYVDAHFEGTLDVFKAKNPEIFTKQGALKAEYRKAEEIINRIERDDFFMRFMSGEKQIIMTANLFGADWKVKLDSYIEDVCIVDLKVMKSLREAHWTRDYGHMDFIRSWGYDIQAAVYQEVVYQNTGKRLPFYIAGASKEKEPDIEVVQVPQQEMDEKLIEVESNIQKILCLKNGEVEPIRCEVCDYCKHTKVLEKPIWPDELLGVI
ncbi:MAG: PD-(D/E)XK nuclease-like domain-containing protein [Sporomusa sp.]